MRLAYVSLPTHPNHSAPVGEVLDGIRACGDHGERGYKAVWDQKRYSDCIAVVWTAGPRNTKIFEAQRRLGGKIVVMENGYLNAADGTRYFSWGFDGYNGQGNHRNTSSPPDRWADLGLDLRPWRGDGDHIVVLAQRGLGYAGHERAWPLQVVETLKRATKRPVVYRPHPGSLSEPEPIEGAGFSWKEPLEKALNRAWCVVGYKTAAMLTAIRLGIPAIALGPCMASPISGSSLAQIERPPTPEREQFFHDLAYAQWNHCELREGIAWRHLLD